MVGIFSWQPYHHPVPLSWNLGTLTSWKSLDHTRPVKGLFYLYRYSFLLENESTPGLRVQPEGLCQWKIPMTLTGNRKHDRNRRNTMSYTGRRKAEITQDYVSFVSDLHTNFYVHVTVLHRNKFLCNKTNQVHEIPKFTPAWNSTCFGQFLCPSSGVYFSYFTSRNQKLQSFSYLALFTSSRPI